MKLKHLILGIVGAFALSAYAEDCDKAPVEAVVEEAPLGATLSAGYMTDYVFYGVDLGANAPWVGLEYTIPGLPVAVDVGVWYINPTETSFDDELDLYASVAGPSFFGFDTSLTFLAYFFPESGADATYELALGVSRSLGFVDWEISPHYDFELDAWYFETGVSKGFGITDNIEVVVSSGIAYSIDYWSPGSNWNHIYVQAALPIALRSNVTLEPFIAGLFALDAVDDFQDDMVYGGVSLTVDF
jgi:hypothetical protein